MRLCLTFGSEAAPVATISLWQLLKKPFMIQSFVQVELSHILFAALQVGFLVWYFLV